MTLTWKKSKWQDESGDRYFYNMFRPGVVSAEDFSDADYQNAAEFAYRHVDEDLNLFDGLKKSELKKCKVGATWTFRGPVCIAGKRDMYWKY